LQVSQTDDILSDLNFWDQKMTLDDWLNQMCMSSSECGRRLKKFVGREVHVSTVSRIRRNIQKPTEDVANGIIKLAAGQITFEDLYKARRRKKKAA